MDKNSIMKRMKENYEFRSQTFLPRRTYTIIRLDGKAFHTYTKNCDKPFDSKLMSDMDQTAKYLCENIQGCKFAYVQSDEISLGLCDFDNTNTDAWLDGNVQKITSISASMATAFFNHARQSEGNFALFDSRCFVIPDPIEVHNYFVARQQDATRNSIQMVGQAHFSHKELQNKSCDQIQEMLWTTHNINWNDYPVGCKRGRCVLKEYYGEPNTYLNDGSFVKRIRWVVVDPPIFTSSPNWVLVNFTEPGAEVKKFQ